MHNLLLSDEFNPMNGHNTNCYDYLLPLVYKFEHLLTSIYKIGPEDSFYERSNMERFYKHRVIWKFIDLMDRILFIVDGLVTLLK